jgi:hypothetical protein
MVLLYADRKIKTSPHHYSTHHQSNIAKQKKNYQNEVKSLHAIVFIKS